MDFDAAFAVAGNDNNSLIQPHQTLDNILDIAFDQRSISLGHGLGCGKNAAKPGSGNTP